MGNREDGPGVVAAFGTTHDTEVAIRKLRSEGYGDMVVYSPVPHDFEDALGESESPMWGVSLTGGILGCIFGYSLCALTSLAYPLVVGGKQPVNFIPYTVIGYEMTILFTGLFTVAGLFFMGDLVRFRTPRAYRPRFSLDQHGLFIPCESDQFARAEQICQEAGAQEVETQ